MTVELTTQKRLGTALFYGILVVLAYLVFLVFEPFLAPLAWAVVLVVVSYPVYARLARKWNPTLAATASTVGVVLILIVPALLVTGAFIHQGVEAVQEVQQQIQSGHFSWVNDLWLRVQARFPDANPGNLTTVIHRYADAGAAYLGSRLGAVLRNTAVFLFHLAVMILAMFYLFRDGDSIVARLREVLPFEKSHRDKMIDETRELIFASVTSSLVAAVAHGVLGGVAFGLTGIRAPIFWGVMMGFFSLIPVVGSALIWVPAAVSLMVDGHIGMGIALMIFCSVIVGLVDNIIRPWMISGRAEMGGLVVFISILGGISVFGMLGVVLGPIVVAAGASMLDLYAPGAPARNTKSKAGGHKLGGVLE
ncbi:MAG TPA: AI-2E family transporter [Candidatus Acidoferrales bacterium]|nr:AI-2E family transporter [Candidatus Acidoferrales bacterium]